MLLTILAMIMMLSLCSYLTLSSYSSCITWQLTLALLALLPFVLYKHMFSSMKSLSSFAIAAAFKWHGPQAFLLLREKLNKGDDTFPIGKRNLVVFNLNVIKHCLVYNASNYDKGGRAARLIAGVTGEHGILAAIDEDDHAPSHRILNPHTKHTHRIQDFEDMVLQETNHKLREWEELVGRSAGHGQTDLYVDFSEIFFKVLYRFMFGIELDTKRFGRVHHVVSKLETYAAVVGFVPSKLLALYNLYRNDVPSLITALNIEVDEIVREGGAGSPLAELQGPAAALDDGQVRDTVKNLLFAGASTAANALGWAVHLLSREERWGERAAKAARQGEGVSFFKNVCAEANRMYPQANVITRRAKEEDEVEGYGVIPKGSVLIIPIIALHYHPAYYRNAHTFNPDRWAEGEKAPPLMSYIPFTAGPRQCIGQSLFNRAGPSVLMRVFQHFSFTPLQSNPAPKWPNAVLPPSDGGFRMIIASNYA